MIFSSFIIFRGGLGAFDLFLVALRGSGSYKLVAIKHIFVLWIFINQKTLKKNVGPQPYVPLQ